MLSLIELEQLTRAQLFAIAKGFGASLDPNTRKAELIQDVYMMQQPKQEIEEQQREEVCEPEQKDSEDAINLETELAAISGIAYDIGLNTVSLQYGGQKMTTTLHQPPHRIINAAKVLARN